MNIHHLELFHHVALHGGITRALPHMPYGIQQPAVSAQLIRLEKDLGVTLFQRRPFELTEAGEELFAFASPFFSRIDDIESSLSRGTRHLRIASAEIVIRDHLPRPIKQLTRKMPDLRLSLRGVDSDSLALLDNGQLDLVIRTEARNAPAGLAVQPLIELTPVLLAPESAGKGSTLAFLKRNSEAMALITPPFRERLCRRFHDDLAGLGITWKPSWELPGPDLVHRYAELGFGIGLTVRESGLKVAPGFRIVPLPRFRKLKMVAYHRRRSDDATDYLLNAIRKGLKLLRV